MVYGEKSKGLPPLMRPSLSKNSQEQGDENVETLYEDNRYWNDWIFQLHWNNPEWVNPRSEIKRKYYIHFL